MKVLELFAGTRSIGKAFEKRGHEVFSVDWNRDFENINLYADIGQLTAQDILEKFGHPDVIWASPDCTTFSVMAISHHRRVNPVTGHLDAFSEYAKQCDAIDQNVLKLIRELNPTYWFIENPRGAMRKMPWMKYLPRYTVTYCQYGDRRQKPTDIWTNHPCPQFKPPCNRGDSCHESAPRFSTVKKMKMAGLDVSHIGGTQYAMDGTDRAIVRSQIPEQLCEHIVDICEMDVSKLPRRKTQMAQMSMFD